MRYRALYVTLFVAGFFVLVAAAPSVAYAITCGTGTDIGGGCRVFLTSTGSNSWSVPSDWSAASNTIEVIGGGGGGASGNGINRTDAGGGGGGYSKVTNISLTPSATVNYFIGTGGAGYSACNGCSIAQGNSGNPTYLCNSTSNCASISGTAVVVAATGGRAGTAAGGSQAAAGGAGGGGGPVFVASTTYSGGRGGNVAAGGGQAASGGGGAGGPNGAGNNGSDAAASTASAGGSGGAGLGGAGGPNTGGAGGAGTEYDGTHGSGGGGGGLRGSGTAGLGGAYGAGGGGQSSGSSGTSGAGRAGLIVITYTPSSPPTVTTDAASSVTATGATINGTITDTGGGSATARGFATSTNSTLSSSVSTSTTSGSFSTGAFNSAFSNGNLVGNTTYYFRAFATNSGTGYGSIRSFLTLPGTPGTPTFYAVTETTMMISWTAPTGGATTYKLERCAGAGCSNFVEIQSALASPTFDDSALSANTTYAYRVRATNATGDGSYSATAEQATSAYAETSPRIIRLMSGTRLLNGVRLR